MSAGMIECAVRNCPRPPIFEDEAGDKLCERHMPDPNVRSWSEMKAEGIEIETMAEYQNEVRGFHDYEPMDDYDALEYDRYYD
jgi:hypothetical protein